MAGEAPTNERDLTGTGYGRPKPTFDRALIEVGPATPMGEYMRRYWHPVAISGDLKDLPIRRKILGEELVIFRQGDGRVGAVYESCAHRGASLFYGRIDEDGIRCCYHGWKFDVEGNCLNQPLEAGGGRCDKVRQPWYPVEELYGLIFIYMGPADQMPLVPRYKGMEDLEEDEFYSYSFESLPGSTTADLPYSWLMDMDNIHDMGHALWLHHLHSGPQFGPAFFYANMDNASDLSNRYKYTETEFGMYSEDDTPFFDGSIVKSRLETQMPNVRFICPPVILGEAYNINWCVPADDASHYGIGVARVKKGGLDMTINPMQFWDRSDPEIVQRQPSDYEAQYTQGPIPRHSEENLVYSDRGVGKMRRQYHRQLKAMAAGERLMNIRFAGEDPYIPTYGGAWLVTPAPEGAATSAEIIESLGDEPVDLAGDWLLSLNTPMGVQEVQFTFTQHGEPLYGVMTGPDGDAVELADGRVVGKRAEWTANVTKPMAMAMKFEIVSDGRTMTGTFKPGPLPPSEITGHRV